VQCLRPEEAHAALLNQVLSPADVRLVPKASGMRPLVNLSRHITVASRQSKRTPLHYSSFSSANHALEPVLAVLKAALPSQTHLSFEGKPVERHHDVGWTSAAKPLAVPGVIASEDDVQRQMKHIAFVDRGVHCMAAGVTKDAEPLVSLAAATPSLDAVYVQLKRFKASWQAAGEPAVVAMAFDVHRAFDNVCLTAWLSCALH
jgi:hypothetical protein